MKSWQTNGVLGPPIEKGHLCLFLQLTVSGRVLALRSSGKEVGGVQSVGEGALNSGVQIPVPFLLLRQSFL